MWESKDSAFPSLLASSFSLAPASLLSLSEVHSVPRSHRGGRDTKQGHGISRNFAETWRVQGWKTVTVGDTTTSR